MPLAAVLEPTVKTHILDRHGPTGNADSRFSPEFMTEFELITLANHILRNPSHSVSLKYAERRGASGATERYAVKEYYLNFNRKVGFLVGASGETQPLKGVHLIGTPVIKETYEFIVLTTMYPTSLLIKPTATSSSSGGTGVLSVTAASTTPASTTTTVK